METRVIIDPIVDIYYASYYIKGLYEIFGERNVEFNSASFANLETRDVNLNFIVLKEHKNTKYSISFDDSSEIKKACYEWCDIYGNVNANWEETPVGYKQKLVSLAPSFGIRLWGSWNTIYFAILNFLKTNQEVSIRKFAGKYKRQYFLRLPLEKYLKTNPVDNYIFHVSSLWQSDEWVNNDNNVNRIRTIFMDVCKSIPEIKFEGGFYYSGDFPLNHRFNHLVFTNFISANKYIEKIKQSILVFNTPAWMNCNGWKLGEYLALGKAIISTPLLNDLPEPLVHGKNVHFVSADPEEIKKAILLICRNKSYREKLEEGAFEYYMRNVTPLKSLELMGIKK